MAEKEPEKPSDAAQPGIEVSLHQVHEAPGEKQAVVPVEKSSEEPKADATPPAAEPRPKAAPAPKKKLGKFSLGHFGEIWNELFDALFSRDAATRKMAVLFFISVFAIATVAGMAIHRMQLARSRHAREMKLAAEEKKREADLRDSQIADLKVKERSANLGRFLVDLKSDARKAPEVSFELYVRCSDKEVKDYVDGRSTEIRSEISRALIDAKREDFLTPAGKKRMHKSLLMTLNQWLAREFPKGKIEELYFSDLYIEN